MSIVRSQADPSDVPGFWARQVKKDRIALAAIGLEVAVSLVLLIVGLTADDKSVGTRFALLTGNMVLLIAVLQVAMGRFFDDQRSHLERLSTELQQVHDSSERTWGQMGTVGNLGDTYGKILDQPNDVRDLYQQSLDVFISRLSSCIDDKRSGTLDNITYYSVLENLAQSLEQDFAEHRESGNGDFAGGIWALTFILDDEWVTENRFEARWFEHLEKMDKAGIKTRRLWALDNRTIGLIKKEPIESEGKELIKRLAIYCSQSTSFANTASFTFPKEEIQHEDFQIFGKGFFAVEHSDGRLGLIRGVCFDNLLSSNSLGGEIDFDEERIESIFHHWKRYLKVAKPLRDHLLEVASPSAKQVMADIWGTP